MVDTGFFMKSDCENSLEESDVVIPESIEAMLAMFVGDFIFYCVS